MAIAFPAILIAYMAMKYPKFVKPIGSIVGMAAATGIIMWVAFGFVSPDTYMIPQQTEVEEVADRRESSSSDKARYLQIQILEGSAQEGNPDYEPDVLQLYRKDIWWNGQMWMHYHTRSLA